MNAFAGSQATRSVAAQMNLTPLVDVMLVLLVIFMLAVPQPTQRLPLSNDSCRALCPPAPQPARLSIKRTGELYWNGAAITRAALAANLAALAQTADAALQIRPEGTARYALLTDALTAAANADVRRVSIVPDRD